MLRSKIPIEQLNYDKIKIHSFSKPSKKYKIFVSIASFRDEELESTLIDLYTKAKHPESIRTFCLMQTSNEDPFNINPYTTKLKIFSIDFGEVNATLSKGVCWARALCQQQLLNEKYFLQIDSHMRFAQDWDASLVELLHETEDSKAILSCYPPAYQPNNTNLIPAIIYNKTISFEDNHSPKLKGHIINSDLEYEKHKLHQWISAGFFFTYANFCKEIPYDPYHYFIGEEIDITTRAYTRNWNSYAPKKCLIWHYYYIKEDNTRVLHWDADSNWIRLSQLSDERVKLKLKIITKEDCNDESKKNIDLFKLGEDRTLEDFQSELGINFKNKSINK